MLAFLMLSVDHFKESRRHYRNITVKREVLFFFLNAGFKLVDRKAHFDQENA